jgi:hypothetical protein
VTSGLSIDMLKSTILAAAAAGLLFAGPVTAQQKLPVAFAKGTSSATMKGTIKGDEYRDYVVNARAGQTMTVTVTNPDGRAYFNVLPPGSTGEAVFIGSSAGNSFKGLVPGTGANTVRVYQMRATGRRGEVANYPLATGADGAQADGSAAYDFKAERVGDETRISFGPERYVVPDAFVVGG